MPKKRYSIKKRNALDINISPIQVPHLNLSIEVGTAHNLFYVGGIKYLLPAR